jgi:antitoxin ParD1/3/4
MHVSLPPELEAFIEQEVKNGLYETPSEVIHAGLRRLQEDKEQKSFFMVSSMEEVEQKLLEGIHSGPAGEMTHKDWQRLRIRLDEHLASKTT